MMRVLCEFLDAVINPVIYIVALAEFVLMAVSVYNLVKFRYRIRKLNSKGEEKSRTFKKEAKGEVTKTVEIESKRNWEDFDRFLEDYQEKGCWYSAFSLIIQIFTLLGILGTVAGLYLAMLDGQDMYRGVELALSTTILGILFAVIYKVADIIIVSALINYIEDGINRYEKIYKVDNEEVAIVTKAGEKDETTQEKDGSGN